MEASKQMDLTGLPLPNAIWLCLSASFHEPALQFSLLPGTDFAFQLCLLPLPVCAPSLSSTPAPCASCVLCQQNRQRGLPDPILLCAIFVLLEACITRCLSLSEPSTSSESYLGPAAFSLLLCDPPPLPPPSFIPPFAMFCCLSRLTFTPALNCSHECCADLRSSTMAAGLAPAQQIMYSVYTPHTGKAHSTKPEDV